MEAHDGGFITTIYSAVDAAEVERTLQEHGLSYQTKIIRSRKKGVYYQIRLLEDTDA
jgi:hypothetical protein